jgi:hypothetical protein
MFDITSKSYININTMLKLNYNDLDLINIDKIYINSHFSKSDILFRRDSNHFLNFYLKISKNNLKIIKISHGWQLMKPNLSFFYFYFFLKHFFKKYKIKNILLKYDETLFISNVSDKYRHYDYFIANKYNLKYSVFSYHDHFYKFLSVNNLNNCNIINKQYILIISNIEPVKNVLFLIFFNYKYFILKKRNKRNFVLLTIYKYSIYSTFIFYILKLYKINVITDQSKKNNLLYNCNYLLIPSFTEYLPIVSLEAFNLKKSVVSLFKIQSLKSFNNYHSIYKN